MLILRAVTMGAGMGCASMAGGAPAWSGPWWGWILASLFASVVLGALLEAARGDDEVQP